MINRTLLWFLALCPGGCIENPWPPDTATEIETFLGYESEASTQATTGDTTGDTVGATDGDTTGAADTTTQ